MTTIQPTAPDKLWTPANIVTLIRICLVPVFVLAILSPWPEWVGLPGITMEAKCVIAAGIFILISCTDWIDGYLARSRGEVTDFGKFMDPLADKILVTAALIALVELAVLPGWPVLIILAREFIVSGIRMVAASKGTVIAASWYGKAKTVFQIIAIVLFLLKDSLTFTTAAGAFTNPMFVLSWTVMVIALILTVMSMLDYLVKARHLLKGSAGGKTAKAAAPSAAPTEIAALQKAIDEQARIVVEKATAAGATVATAESLTGGLIAAMLTSVPGSSASVRGGIVSFSAFPRTCSRDRGPSTSWWPCRWPVAPCASWAAMSRWRSRASPDRRAPSPASRWARCGSAAPRPKRPMQHAIISKAAARPCACRRC